MAVFSSVFYRMSFCNVAPFIRQSKGAKFPTLPVTWTVVLQYVLCVCAHVRHFQSRSHLVSMIVPCGVPDELCTFPADESQTNCPEIPGLSGPITKCLYAHVPTLLCLIISDTDQAA